MLANIGYAVAYTGVGILLLVVGALALDLLTPGHLARHIYEERSVNAGIALAAGFLGQGAIAFTTIWTNATSGFGEALADTVVFGLVGIALQVVAFLVLDLLTPGHLAKHIYEERSVNAGIALAAGFLGQGAIAFATIWTNATSGFGTALGYTVVFGLVGIALQVVAFLVLDLLTPGKLGHLLVGVPFHPASLVSAASTLAVSAIIIASIWP